VAQGAKPNPSDLDRVKPGVAAPAFTLPDAQGTPHTLSSFRDTPTVLVFYRGYW
jgi:peroxiredoxin